MIISCNSCNKNFNVDSYLIPEKGRILQCSSCHHKWFFKKESTQEFIETADIDKHLYKPNAEKKKPLTKIIKNFQPTKIDKDILVKKNLNKTNNIKSTKKELIIINSKNKKKNNILSLILVFIISFIAIIIVLDTLKGPIGKFIPNIDFFLHSLYETINDIFLFLNDLIK